MNNEDKAREISEMCGRPTYCGYHRIKDYSKEDCFRSAIKMAEWKDEQFYKFLLWLDDNYVIRRFTDGEPMTYGDLVDNFKNKSYERDTTKTD